MSTLDAARRSPGPLTGVGLVLTLGVFSFVGGVVGAGAALLVGVAALFAGPLVAFVVGHLALVLVAPGPTGLTVVLAELGLGPLLLASVTATTDTLRTRLLAGLGFVAVAAALVVVRALVEPLWGEVGLLVLGLTLLGYGLHRYELVRLDLVTEPDHE